MAVNGEYTDAIQPWRGMAIARPDVEQACRMILDLLYTARAYALWEAQKQKITQSRITKTFYPAVSAATISKAIVKLEEQEFVERKRVGHDTYVWLTEKGRLASSIVASAQSISAQVMGVQISGAGSTVVYVAGLKLEPAPADGSVSQNGSRRAEFGA